MKPFFSIRIEWNPADSQDESHRDCFTVKKSVARQVKPCPNWVSDEAKRAAPLSDDTSNVVHCITTCLEDLRREAKWMLPDLISDIVFDLAIASAEGLDEQALRLTEIAVDGCGDEFLDSLQKLIDKERAKAKPEPKE